MITARAGNSTRAGRRIGMRPIDADAFENVSGMTILGIPGTRAQSYAQEKDFYFIPIA